MRTSHPCPFCVPQVCDPLIDCVWHVNFGWLSTNNPTWLQRVSSNICNFLTPFATHFMPLMCKSSFVGAQRREVCDPLIYCVWHVNFGWLSTNNLIWLQDVSSDICNFFASSHFPFHVYICNFFDLFSLLISCLWCELCLLELRYANHWLIVFGMWISGGYQRTIWHDYRM